MCQFKGLFDIQSLDLFKMGNTNNPNEPLQKGEGYRIIAVKDNSPFHNKVEPFFDFIIEVTPPVSERSPTDILDKLSGPSNSKSLKLPLQTLKENVDKTISVKIVSTKYRKVRSIEVIPNNKWGDGNDLIGTTFRRERFDEAFETYFPLVDIKANSPIKKAGVREGQYLIGCQQFAYPSIENFMEGLYEKYFDKESKDKTVHLAVYDIATDSLALREVTLGRGWGGKGLLGCEFLQGMLNKFPSNLEQQRQELLKREAKKNEIIKLRNEMGECDGASKVLAESLLTLKNKKMKNYQKLRNILNAQPPKLSIEEKAQKSEKVEKEEKVERIVKVQKVEMGQSKLSEAQAAKDRQIKQLEQRVTVLETSLRAINKYLSDLAEEEEEEERQ